MTVATLLLNFRSALIALVPSVERVGIFWKRPDAYDEWDAISSALFDKLVVSVLRWSLPDGLQEDFCLPPYDLLLASYDKRSTLEVNHPCLPTGRWVFHAFGTEHQPFDTVEIRKVSEAGLPLSKDLASCPVEEVEFRLKIFQGRKTEKILDEIEVWLPKPSSGPN